MDKIVATSSNEPERIQMKLDLEPTQANAVAALFHEYLEGKIRVCTPAVSLDGESYSQAAAAVTADERTSYFLRQRMSEDQSRDPVDALADAELQLALRVLPVSVLAKACLAVERGCYVPRIPGLARA